MHSTAQHNLPAQPTLALVASIFLLRGRWGRKSGKKEKINKPHPRKVQVSQENMMRYLLLVAGAAVASAFAPAAMPVRATSRGKYR